MRDHSHAIPTFVPEILFLLALSSSVPLFVTRSAAGMTPAKDSRVLVVVELDGGNDALNTVVPFTDENYAKFRPKLKLDPKRLVKLDASVGLHPAMKPLEKLFQAGQLGVIPGASYPNPNRSHFESMAVWHTMRFGEEDRKGYGWLGRAMDPSAGNLFSVGADVPTALRGRRSSAVAFNRIEEVLLSDTVAVKQGIGADTSNDLLAFVRRQAVDAQVAGDKLAKLAKANGEGGASYPATRLADRLRLVSRLLKADIGARVFYTRQSGYDTHAQQMFTHSNLLGEFAGAVAAFLRRPEGREAGRARHAVGVQRVRADDQRERLGRDGPRHDRRHVRGGAIRERRRRRDDAEPDRPR